MTIEYVRTILRQKQKGLPKVISASLLVHIVLLFIVLVVFKDEKRKVFIAPAYTVNLVELPPAKVPEKKVVKKKAPKKKVAKKKAVKKKAPKKKAAKKKVVKKKAAPKKKTVKKKAVTKVAKKGAKAEKKVSVEDAIKRLQEKADKEKRDREIKEKREREERVAAIREALKKGAASKAPAVRRERITRADFEVKHKEYYSETYRRIKENWIYPGNLNEAGLTATVGVKIGSSGELLKVFIEESSGNRLYNDSTLKAVRKSAPFPPLPADLDSDFIEIGFRFCPTCGDEQPY